MATILVVDDDVIYVNLLANILQEENHNVFFSNDGAEALKLCESQKFDLIITDILMPNVDGIELIMALKKCNSHAPVIAISVANLYLQSASALGAYSILHKPFSSRQLFDAINGALSGANTE